MNYLAHAALAEPTDEARLGAILGDFAKGLDEPALPEATRYALLEHRALDRWFDAREDVRATRDWFPPALKRFSGILLDVFVDHVLANEWERLGPGPLEEVSGSLYRSFETYAHLLPPRLAQVGPRMAAQDWLGGYGDRGNIGLALAGIERRMRRDTGIAAGIAILDSHAEPLRELTLRVVPEAFAWAAERRARDGRAPAV